MPPREFSPGRSLVVLFAVAAFSNAALLFSVEPMFAKLLLPLLGGTPSVWNTALVFFQAVLLAGYGYAHLTTRLLPLRRQLALHAALLLLSALALPLRLRLPGDPPGGDAAIPWMVLALTMSLAFPFMMLASGAPLLQRWFAVSRHARAGNPYFLYAASNLGSLCALVGYPLLVEPWFTLAAQRGAWSVAYVAVMVVIGACALRAGHSARVTTPGPEASIASIDTHFDTHFDMHSDVARPTTRDRLEWVVYSAVPSSLLLGVTAYVSTDLAAVPLLWVVPLALYLLTFVLTFAARPFPHAWMVRVEPYLLILAVLQVYWSAALPGLLGVAFHFVLFFVIAMVCHGELSRRRPPAAWLTEFFVWISVGGLVGGVFNALLAPLLFDRVVEYAAVLTLAGFLRPNATPSADDTTRDGDAPAHATTLDVLVPVALLLALLFGPGDIDEPPRGNLVAAVAMGAAGIVLFSTASRARRFGFALTAVVGAALLRDEVTPGAKDLLTDRSFFGVYRVREVPSRSLRQLIHGTTLHGAQSMDPSRRLYPLTYYHRAGPMGDVFGMPPAAAARERRVGVIGLGIGSLACYGRPNERWTFYEIDPLVLHIARDHDFFTFLRDCPPRSDVVIGDARLSLRDAETGSLDVLVLDAFSSDAIPVHLLTREAFALYDRVLSANGVLAVHISNRYLDLEPVVAALVSDAAHVARIRADRGLSSEQQKLGYTGSVWVLVARRTEDLGAIATDQRWTVLRPGRDVWTDDFSNILRVLR